jgi:hypothetical protein
MTGEIVISRMAANELIPVKAQIQTSKVERARRSLTRSTRAAARIGSLACFTKAAQRFAQGLGMKNKGWARRPGDVTNQIEKAIDQIRSAIIRVIRGEMDPCASASICG